ncbi:hypothetical protein PAPYR_12389 [Paratrimastix pyriformis]|uniref:Uncharacterized protein n=1 Tax=Paratrimastix pyriformis TaxID=342808 RepID=A0ABQ8U1Z7_9EUKA|nr:hypothetical protein PAPYR_12389 [Paratrimastix pyriformis]
MWQANLTEWYEENPDGDNLKKEENPPSGTTSRASLGDTGWVGMDTMEENKGTTSRRRKTRRRGQPQGASLGDIGWVGTDTEENPRGQPQKEENPPKGQPHEEGAEENPTLGKTSMVGWRTMPGMGMRHRLATSGHTTLAQVAGAGFLLLTVCANVFLVAVCLVDSFEFRQCSWDREVWKGDWLGYHGCK